MLYSVITMIDISLIVIVAIIILLTPIAIAACSLAPWVPTHSADFARIHVQSALQSGAIFYELGCGEGRVCRYMASHNPDAKIIGIEKAYPLFVIARIRQWIAPYNNLSYIYGDVMRTDISDADVVYTYAMIQTIQKKLQPKFFAELRPHAHIISYQFSMKDWPYAFTIDESLKNGGRLYVYSMGSSVQE